MTDDDIKDLKHSIADASDEQRRELQKHLKASLPDDTDNRNAIGFRTSMNDKTLLSDIAARANTTVSALCRTTIRDALRHSFGG
jgi:hypothetical protein